MEGVEGVAATLPAAALRFSCARLSSKSSAVGCSVVGAGGVTGSGVGDSTGAGGVGVGVGA